MYKYFIVEEFACSETGENEIQDRFIRRLDILRERCGFALVVTSGYRSPNHSIEAAKPQPGQHTSGRCADLAVHNGRERHKLLSEALDMGFSGVGVDKHFIHLDERSTTPVLWTY